MPRHTTRDVGERAFSVAQREAKVFAEEIGRNIPLEDEIIQEVYEDALRDLEGQGVDQLGYDPHMIKTTRNSKSKSKKGPRKKPKKSSKTRQS
ncbi:MAG: hypothetical protein A3A96_04325 [Candidatus Zambryskibacteria bacterium RIFCSPLOWO2_01_FULL_39_39]|uniref:Uncharacterized protein n=1 Tax=Candidatus Zambryskibacteria bacterium RIFCSPLOWO2_01_FULL_39_39 TaxID=1802758 RepID=A0A1G2TWQ8_9BACT|nr:MAG: hypothetical protein UT00_C0003G0043 [Parcubacteria group bacterium GW2011_GWA1_38_7]OHA87359.1 MAG: hypothetical protein A2644_04005 [Candidatus Zambryskibacteria bacterium RIFCSPHIGHO2_01_FULL_39_63]OHA95324.1 MAG: hypothetical protein A3B88_02490 [Candidatus Zambryskibacteria bacterium RIFCSPHIGHO2_02_FULL_39_19]OHA97998.1 MAG: hypothetical protein A3F20_04470 [Candidatus Zambryskibacteria bacterium RIFCSPHIGHO2_12_FULL_39_21]OHB01755.1 MAG: hypothetical protein A3A96_04325 [Candidat